MSTVVCGRRVVLLVWKVTVGIITGRGSHVEMQCNTLQHKATHCALKVGITGYHTGTGQNTPMMTRFK